MAVCHHHSLWMQLWGARDAEMVLNWVYFVT